MTQPGLITEWRYSTGYVASSVLGGLFVASLPLGLFLLDANKGPAWLIPALAVFLGGSALGGILNVVTLRIRLSGKRIEKANFLGTRSLLRQGILGRRRQSNGDFTIVPREGQGRALLLPQRVMRVAEILTWLESLEDLDVKDYLAAQAILEKDDRLGSTAAGRQDSLAFFRRLGGVASLAGVGLALWAIFLPQPEWLVAALCVASPLVAVLVAARWHGVVSLLAGNADHPGVGLVGLWFMPPMGIAILALGYTVVDWRTALIVAVPVAVLFVAASLLADKTLRNPLLAVFVAIIAYAWAWGGLVVANAQFDKAMPSLIAGTVISASTPEDRQLTISMASPALAEPIEDIKVSSSELKKLAVGAKTCLLVFPGRLGWRYAFLALCPANSPTESTVLVLPPAGSRYRHARPRPPTAGTPGR